MAKKQSTFLPISVLLVLTLLSALLAGCFPSNNFPAPENLESMEVYQFLSQTIHADSSSAEIIHAFSQMCDIPVACLDDRILVESLYYEDFGVYDIRLVRQFEFSDNTEFVQLHINLSYTVDSAGEYPTHLAWYQTGDVDIRKILTELESFHAVEGAIPKDIIVSIDWTW